MSEVIPPIVAVVVAVVVEVGGAVLNGQDHPAPQNRVVGGGRQQQYQSFPVWVLCPNWIGLGVGRTSFIS